MAKAYYPSGSSFKEWTPEMVGALGIKGENQLVSLTHNTTNATGFRTLWQTTVSNTWLNCRAVYIVTSRHSGTGILCVGFSTMGSLTEYTWDLELFGQTAGTTYGDCFSLAYNTSTHVLSLYARLQDYNDCKISVLGSTGLPMPSNGTWVTSLPTTNTARINVRINNQQIYVQDSQPTSPSAILWIDP